MNFDQILTLLRLDETCVFDSIESDMFEQDLTSLEYWIFTDEDKEENIRKIKAAQDWTLIGFTNPDGSLRRINQLNQRYNDR